jgi:LPS-assembly lipoprotein
MISRRRLILGALTLPAALAGCGWEPLYADRETGLADEELRAIRVRPIAERIGQRLETALRSSLNPSGQPVPARYALNVTLSVSKGSLGVQSQGLGTRGDVNVTANYVLTDLKTGTQLQTASVHTAESFDIQANGYSTVVAQDDAFTRTVEEMRREIIARLTLFMQRRKAVAAS